MFTVVRGHSEKTSMEPVGIGRGGEGLMSEYFEIGLKEDVVGKE